MIQEWIIKHPYAVAYLVTKYTILVCDKLIGKKNQRVGKYLI